MSVVARVVVNRSAYVVIAVVVGETISTIGIPYPIAESLSRFLYIFQSPLLSTDH